MKAEFATSLFMLHFFCTFCPSHIMWCEGADLFWFYQPVVVIEVTISESRSGNSTWLVVVAMVEVLGQRSDSPWATWDDYFHRLRRAHFRHFRPNSGLDDESFHPLDRLYLAPTRWSSRYYGTSIIWVLWDWQKDIQFNLFAHKPMQFERESEVLVGGESNRLASHFCNGFILEHRMTVHSFSIHCWHLYECSLWSHSQVF